MIDLLKATCVCGGIAFLVYTFPLLSQAALIGLLGLLWFSCAHRTLGAFLRK